MALLLNSAHHQHVQQWQLEQSTLPNPSFFFQDVILSIKNGSNIYFLYFFYRYEYRWADGVTIKKPIEVSAPKYVEYLMEWIETQLDNESIFPQRLGKW